MYVFKKLAEILFNLNCKIKYIINFLKKIKL